MLKKLFGGKNEFFVQLDEKQTATPETSVSESTPEPVAAAPETPTPAKSNKSKKTSVKKSAKKSEEIITPEPTPVVAPKAKADPTQVAFASADPILQNVARRGPGPSLNKFKEMARQVKIR